MAKAESDGERIAREAADWFMRLNSRVVPTKILSDFYAWRAEPAHGAAYEEVETAWRRMNALQGDPAIDAAVEAALGRRNWRTVLEDLGARRDARLYLPVGAILALLLAAALGLWLTGGDTYQTRLGQTSVVRLADGSQVRLDTDTKVRVRFSDTARDLQLVRGQAFFDVAHDRARPFEVRTADARVRALGTRFDVRLRSGVTQVVLVEGAVEVRGQATPQEAPVRLKAGQQVSVARTVAAPAQADLEAATSWTTGRLIFRQTPLEAAVAEVNRYSPHKVSVEAQGLADTPVSGSFEAGDTEAFAAAVADLFDLKLTRRPDGALVLRAAPSAG